MTEQLPEYQSEMERNKYIYIYIYIYMFSEVTLYKYFTKKVDTCLHLLDTSGYI